MPDDRELVDADPFDAQDDEAERLVGFFASLSRADWERPSRCEGWSVRDVLGHLRSSEDYHQACLDGRVADLLAEFAERGATDLHTANAMGVADYAERAAAQLLDDWQGLNADTRRRFRERGDGVVDTSVGEYPCRWQAFHVASEWATHADDVGVPVADEVRDRRRDWRAGISRFALAEVKPELTIEADDGWTIVSDGTRQVQVDDDTLVEAVAGRLGDASDFDPVARAMLSAMP